MTLWLIMIILSFYQKKENVPRAVLFTLLDPDTKSTSVSVYCRYLELSAGCLHWAKWTDNYYILNAWEGSEKNYCNTSCWVRLVYCQYIPKSHITVYCKELCLCVCTVAFSSHVIVVKRSIRNRKRAIMTTWQGLLDFGLLTSTVIWLQHIYMHRSDMITNTL